MGIRFEWDDAKAASNVKKHGVDFSESTRVFADPFALFKQDRVEGDEERWQVIGTVDGVKLLVVAHTTWEQDDTELVRIISARPAERKEKDEYGENN